MSMRHFRAILVLFLITVLGACSASSKLTLSSYTPTASVSATGTPKPRNYEVHGIDVARYQGDIDWNLVRKAGVSFAFIKATEGGDHLDVKFKQNWLGAKRAGVPYGAYHFYYFCRPVEDQIAWFKKNVPVDRNSLPPVLDMEWNAHSKNCRIRPPRIKVLADMQKFLTEIELHYGKRPIIYTSVDFYADNLRGAFKNYPFWVRSVADYPSARYGNRKWVFWQFTAEGRVSGIKGDVDRNVFKGSAAEWQQFLHQGYSSTLLSAYR